MKILIAGNWHSKLHEEPVFRAFENIGHDPVPFGWHSYFDAGKGIRRCLSPFLRGQHKYVWGPVVDRINRDLCSKAMAEKPDVLFVYRGILIYRNTLEKIRQASPDTYMVGYNNDDPFSPLYPKWQWRHFIDSIPEYDLLLAYRHHNLADFQNAGAKDIQLLRSWFIPEVNYPLPLTDKRNADYECDVVFVGHYEDDGRLEYLERIVDQGWKLRLFGPGYEWDKVVEMSSQLKSLAPVRLVWGTEYNQAICGAKIALCFFSKLNRDTYTRRCFEIPASGTVLCSEYSDDLAGLFEAGREALFFKNPDEMVDQVGRVLADPQRCEKIAAAGMKRVRNDGHDVTSRMKMVIDWIETSKERGGVGVKADY